MTQCSSSGVRVSRLRVFTAMALAVAATAVALASQAQQELHFFVSFADATGTPLTDVMQDELQMTENGTPGTILQLEAVGRPPDVTLLLDNGVGMGPALAELRSSARAFFSRMPDGTRMALVTLAPQPRWVQRPTTSQAEVLRAVDRVVPDEALARYLDALVEFGGRLGKDSETRHAIAVAIGTNAPDGSTSLERHFKQLAQRLLDHGATVHAAIVSTNVRLTGPRVPEGVTSDLQHVVARELTRLTGGRYEQLAVSSRLVTLLPEIASQIKADSHRYRLRVQRPRNATGNIGSVAFGISRPGVTVRATYAATPR